MVDTQKIEQPLREGVGKDQSQTGDLVKAEEVKKEEKSQTEDKSLTEDLVKAEEVVIGKPPVLTAEPVDKIVTEDSYVPSDEDKSLLSITRAELGTLRNIEQKMTDQMKLDKLTYVQQKDHLKQLLIDEKNKLEDEERNNQQ